MGAGLGTSLQILVLVVQNAFPVSVAGVATATNNYSRQVGAPVAAAVVAACSPRGWPDCRPAGISGDARVLTPGQRGACRRRCATS